MRIAVIGAGTAGLTAAWLLAPTHDTTLYEAGPRAAVGIGLPLPTTGAGGGTGSRSGRGAGRVGAGAGAVRPAPGTPAPHPVPLGADGPPAPLGAVDAAGAGGSGWPGGADGTGGAVDAGGSGGPDDPDGRGVPLSLTVMSPRSAEPLLVTPLPPLGGRRGRAPVAGTAWRALRSFLAASARPHTAGSGPDATVGGLAAALRMPNDVYERVLLPWLAAGAGCRLVTAAGMPARLAAGGALATAPGGALDPAAPPGGSAGGLGSLVGRMAEDLGPRLRLSHSVLRVTSEGPGGSAPLAVHTADGARTAYDRVIVATGAPEAARLLAGDPAQAVRVALLRALPYATVTVAVHRDPRHMPLDRRHWSAVNVQGHGPWGESTLWYGALGGPDLFVSHITHRAEPERVLHRARLSQPLLTAEAVAARRELRGRPVSPHIQLAGGCLHDAGDRESAVRTALAAVENTDPTCARARRLRALLADGAREAAG
ncbi:FAD-dependent oxidoreductase [Streptomyces fradiae]|uniref:FAD-dependent oxidoreductase n=1 Tax=Streptomyces fradiae TaxID=1906 RepID=UPI002943CE17|nr:FAD-dependent oxidoreductase [Streptomyces fradiae]WOI61890.1 FAD-dependent oxidoreductase [Streptomyces fradiae]